MKKQSKSSKPVEKNCIDVVDIKLDESSSSSSSSDSDGHRNIKVRLLLFVNKYIGKKDVSSFIRNKLFGI
jgi:hypothetical protein